MDTSLGALGQGEQEVPQAPCVSVGHTLVFCKLKAAHFHHLAQLLAAGADVPFVFSCRWSVRFLRAGACLTHLVHPCLHSVCSKHGINEVMVE